MRLDEVMIDYSERLRAMDSEGNEYKIGDDIPWGTKIVSIWYLGSNDQTL